MDYGTFDVLFDVLGHIGILETLLLCFCVMLSSYISYIGVTCYVHCFHYRKKKFKKDVILVVIAHPDDECMFFGPAIVNLIKAGNTVYVLSLSPGDHENQGRKRKEELRQSCKILGIPSGNVIIIQHSKLPDNPDLIWNKVVVANLVLKYMKDISVNMVLTFDKYGISSHKNHISIYKALRYLQKRGQISKGCKVYALQTVNIIRKYSSFMDAPMSYLFGELAFISTSTEVSTIQMAMKEHKTQDVWFRKLYMTFSRYIYVNSFCQVTS